jgi:hypothetical protein
MADENQFKLIWKGVKVWNNWRKENPNINVGLSGTDLRGADLRDADL